MKINKFNYINVFNILNVSYGKELYTYVSSVEQKIKYLNLLYKEIKERQKSLEVQAIHFMKEREEFYKQQKMENDKSAVEHKKFILQQEEFTKKVEEFKNYIDAACDPQLYKNMESETLAELLDNLMPFSNCVTIYNALDVEKKSKVLNYMKNIAKKRALTYNALKLKGKIEKSTNNQL